MLVKEVVTVDWHTGSTPDKLEVVRLLFFGVRLEHAPETGHNRVGILALRVRSNRPKFFNVEDLLTAGTNLNLLPPQVAESVDFAV